MAEWFEAEKLKPMADNTHGSMWCITYWPMHAIDDDGNMTATIVGGRQHIVRYETVGNGGRFDDPAAAEACGEWFGDDYCYAEQPSHWARCIANPDGSEVRALVSHVDGKPVDKVV